MSPENIDLILLVGGSTRIPLVQHDIEQYLGKKTEFAVNPDYAVAEGAAIQSGIINGEIDETSSIMMTDVNPFTLGVQSSDFERNDNNEADKLDVSAWINQPLSSNYRTLIRRTEKWLK